MSLQSVKRFSGPAGHVMWWHIERIDHMSDIAVLIRYAQNQHTSWPQQRATHVQKFFRLCNMLKHLKTADCVVHAWRLFRNILDSRLSNAQAASRGFAYRFCVLL